MDTSSDEYSSLVTSTANRLRLLQVDFADQSDPVRQSYLSEELTRALASVLPDKRNEFLEELGKRFPTWDGKVEVAPEEKARVDRSAVDLKELQDPGFLIGRLIELAPSMSEATRLAVGEKLLAAGLGKRTSGGWSDQAAGPVRAKLQLSAQQLMDANRVVELVDLLLDFAINLDQLVWSTWREVAADSRVKRPGPLLKSIKGFVTADANYPRPALATDVGNLRQLTAAMVNAVGEIGRKFGNEHSERFSPGQIEDAVRAEGKGGTGVGMYNKTKLASWDKYVELAASLESAVIEKDINAAIAESVERLTKGLVR